MIMHFPVPYKDELLSSIIARYIDQQGLTSEKVALELLFGSRNIVPSSLFQGHIQALLEHVGHIWKITSENVIKNHTLLAVFKPFIDSTEFKIRQQELTLTAKNQSFSRLGINASNLIWAEQFKYCPKCLNEDLEQLGETYWRRHFQLPGMYCCPIHNCLLRNSGVDTKADHRHEFVQPEINLSNTTSFSSHPLFASISQQIYSLLNISSKPHTLNQWSQYYRELPERLGLMKGKKIDHSAIKQIITWKWNKKWLSSIGLDVSGENNWLLSIFRKHRRPFTYLHHLTVLTALIGDNFSIENELNKVDLLPDEEKAQLNYSSSNHENRKDEYRHIWQNLLTEHQSLKEIRATKEGARVYSWLYRFDREWHLNHLPTPLSTANKKLRVDWHARDKKIVRQLLKVEKETYEDLSLPRKSKAWYARQVEDTGLILDKCHKLPLCTKFFERYLETIEEYQIRRIIHVVSSKLKNNELPKIFEVERLCGLSTERTREPAEFVLKVDLLRFLRDWSSKGKKFEPKN